MTENNLSYCCPICIDDFTDEGVTPFQDLKHLLTFIIYLDIYNKIIIMKFKLKYFYYKFKK